LRDGQFWYNYAIKRRKYVIKRGKDVIAMEKLDICPFCGGSSLKYMKHGSKREGMFTVYVRCKQCHARGPMKTVSNDTAPEDEVKIAALAWNTRDERNKRS
jgi:Lar family restriction alleviation protein